MTPYSEADISLANSIGAVGGPRSEHASWLLAAAPAVAFVAQVAATDSYYTALTAFYSGTLAALTAVVLARCMILRPQRIPAIEYALFYYYLTFGLGATMGALGVGVANYTPHPDAFEKASALALVSAVAMLAGHSVWSIAPPRASRWRYLPNLTPDMLASASAPYVFIATVFVLAIAIVPGFRMRIVVVRGVAEIVFGLVPLATVATVAYGLWPRTRTFVQLTLALGSTLAATFVTSMIGEALTPMVAVAAVWWRVRGRIPVALAIGGIAVFYVLQPVKSYYRAIMWDDRNTGTAVIDGWQQAFATASADRNKVSGTDATRERMSELATLAYVTDLVPSSLPYIGGDAYEQTVISIVPRILWHDKPNMTKEGLDRYTIALGLTSAETADRSTTGLQLVTHGYMSHGVVGSVSWALLFGFVLGAVNRFFGVGIAGTISMTAFMAGWVPTAGSGFVGCFGSLFQSILAALALVWLLWFFGRLLHARRATRPFSRAEYG